jgi:hypothetical protein
LNTVKVPYEIKETIIIKEPKTETITVKYTEPYEVREFVTEKIPHTTVECGYRDINFSVEYIGDLSKMAYDYRTETGYYFNPSSPTGANPMGKYVQKARVCNQDLNVGFRTQQGGLRITFRVCFLYNGMEVGCPNTVNLQVYTKPCKETSKFDMMWIVPFDPRRDIKLKPISVTQKWVCEEKLTMIDGKQTQTVKILQRELERNETKEVLIDKQIEQSKIIQVTLWEKLRRDYGF